MDDYFGTVTLALLKKIFVLVMMTKVLEYFHFLLIKILVLVVMIKVLKYFHSHFHFHFTLMWYGCYMWYSHTSSVEENLGASDDDQGIRVLSLSSDAYRDFEVGK